jgi:TFIIF-interacting CTD phosphatase-like protein
MNNAHELSAELDERLFHQQLRIVRQRELVAKLEQRDDSAAVLARARSVLTGLEFGLADLIDARALAKINKAAKPRLAIVQFDASVHQ